MAGQGPSSITTLLSEARLVGAPDRRGRAGQAETSPRAPKHRERVRRGSPPNSRAVCASPKRCPGPRLRQELLDTGCGEAGPGLARAWHGQDPVSVQEKVTAIHGPAAGDQLASGVAADRLRRPAIAGGQLKPCEAAQAARVRFGALPRLVSGGLFGPVRQYSGGALPR
ncbi:DUF6192 family protein [Streptomyces longisporoflavus]|uniref:DUF6192 family protein n=1 Tax=Streptomyces longisporoflavus TaxID=28044 RepID=A0ABW7R069_9ACTN